MRRCGFLGGLWLAAGALTAACGKPDEPAPPPARMNLSDAEAELAAHAAREAGPTQTPVGASSPAAAPPATKNGLTLGARLLDERAQPIADGELAWIELGEDGIASERASARSDASGAVWLVLPRAELPASGPLALAARGPATQRQFLALERARWEHAPLVSLAELTLLPGGALAGRVLDADGRPLAGAVVGVGPEPGELAGERAARARVWPLLDPFGSEPGRELVPPLTRTDAEGRYVLAGVPCGRAMVVALGSGSDGAPLLPDREQGLSVLAGQDTRVRELVLRASLPEQRVTGVVLAPDGSPLAGAFVTLEQEGVSYPGGRTRSTAEGRFVLLAPPSTEFSLLAEEGAGRWPPIEIRGVRAGAASQVLRFTEPTGGNVGR